MARSRAVFCALVPVLVVGLSQPAQSMPNFARRTGMSCNGCHTTIPRLNETGFQFRKAGFRMPSELGQDAKATFEGSFAARLQGRGDYKHHQEPSGTTKKTTNSVQLTFHEATLYPLSSAWGKYYASLTELSVLSEDFIEVENAYVRFSQGTEKNWCSARFGVMHPFEGYGASDRPYSISRPFFQGSAANQQGSTFFTPWNFDETGFEFAYQMNRTSLSATVFNGIYVKDDEGAFKAFPAQGGNLQKAAGFKMTNAKDWQIFLNQILKEDGSGVSAHFYRGEMDLPTPGTAASAFDPSTSFGNNFYRLAFYGDWRLVPMLNVQGGYQMGRDHTYSTTTGSSNDTFDSQGYFGELDVPVNEYCTLGARYDFFDPSKDKDKNDKFGLTVFANLPLNDGLQAIAEFQHIQQKQSNVGSLAVDDKKDDNFQLRGIWIW